MNTKDLLPEEPSPTANRVPPSASKQSELSLAEQIKQSQEQLETLLLRQRQQSSQHTEDTAATLVRTVTTKPNQQQQQQHQIK